jgi:hypothetical protein
LEPICWCDAVRTMSEFIGTMLTQLKTLISELPWFSDIAGIAGLAITLVGFVWTIRSVMKARRSVEDMRQRVTQMDTVSDLTSVVETMEHIRRLLRHEAWPETLDLYSRIRRALVQVRANYSSLPEEHQTRLQGTITQTRNLQGAVEQAIADPNAARDVTRWNKVLSRQVEEITEVIVFIRNQPSWHMASKVVELLRRLTLGTEEGRVRWEATARPDTFQATFPRYSVTIRSDEDPESWRETFEFAILNQEGSVMEKATPGSLSTEDATSLATLQTLFTAARRNAMGLNEALDEIMEDLPEEKPPFWSCVAFPEC